MNFRGFHNYVHVYWTEILQRHRYPSQRKFLVFTGDGDLATFNVNVYLKDAPNG